MAAVLLVLGAVAIRERVEKSKAAKKMNDDLRYQELQAETERRLSAHRTESGESGHVIDHEASEEEDEVPPPAYEQVLRTQSGRSYDAELPERLERKSSKSRRQSIRKLMKLG